MSMLTANIPGMIDSGMGLISAVADNGINYKGSRGGRSFNAELHPFVSFQLMDTLTPSDIRITHGRPLNEERTLSSLSGFVKCSGASVSCAATSAQTSQINQLLNSGVYLE